MTMRQKKRSLTVEDVDASGTYHIVAGCCRREKQLMSSVAHSEERTRRWRSS
jgi:hypothetical protein